MTAVDLLTKITDMGASDIFIVAGLPLSYKLHNQIYNEGEEKLMPTDTAQLINEIYELAGARDMSHLTQYGDDDFSFALRGVARFRINAYKQRGSLSAVIRVITFTIPKPLYPLDLSYLFDTYGLFGSSSCFLLLLKSCSFLVIDKSSFLDAS